MDQLTNEPPRQRYIWPWFLLGAVLLAIALAVLWMTAAVRRTREYRDPMTSPMLNRPAQTSPASASNSTPSALSP